jgi:hypothetical protein
VVSWDGERQKNRRAFAMRDAVALCAEPLDRNLDEFTSAPMLGDATHQAMK